MPYIKPASRGRVMNVKRKNSGPRTVGELAYALFKESVKYMRNAPERNFELYNIIVDELDTLYRAWDGARITLIPSFQTPFNSRLAIHVAKFLENVGHDPENPVPLGVTGVIANVRDEFKRRFLFPYEDAKREENGDVL